MKGQITRCIIKWQKGKVIQYFQFHVIENFLLHLYVIANYYEIRNY